MAAWTALLLGHASDKARVEWEPNKCLVTERDSFTRGFEIALELARKAAAKTGSGTVEPPHVAEGLIEFGRGAFWEVWKSSVFDITRFREINLKTCRAFPRKIERSLRGGLEYLTPFSRETEELLRLAVRIARRMNSTSFIGPKTIHVGPEHLFLALLELKGLVATTLMQMGLSPEKVTREIEKQFDPFL